MKPSVVLAVGLVVALSFAGCLGEGGGEKDVALGDPAAPTYESEVEVGSGAGVETGTLLGTVFDEFDNPIAGAVVQLADTSDVPANATAAVYTASTNAEGKVSFTKVPVGAYSVTATAEGYDARNTAVNIQKGAEATFELRLPALITDAAANVTHVFQGRVTCWVSAIQGVSRHCGDLPTVNQQLKAAGKEHMNRFVIATGLNATPPVEDRLFEVWAEAKWTVTRAGDNEAYPPLGMRLVLGDANDTAGDRVQNAAGDGDANPPVRVIVPADQVEAWGKLEGGYFVSFLDPGTVFSAGAIVDVAYELHVTAFYNAPGNPCWSAMLGGPRPC